VEPVLVISINLGYL